MLSMVTCQGVTNVTGQPPGTIFFFVCPTHDDGIYRLYRNFENSITINPAEYSRRGKL
jgi:hypothetical protein